ncbi:hypothetical protein [Anaeromyxobacter diazotrophicus]|uniref:Uncharacterized protein n=1 Tax=Anaeromyxobacter diazotrophicus TaxID=2590199 RepID=A0A7I9VRN8_9BACT|nr:hypothetical protein [Anaeromyxobacter diazotrophicus]GEJ59096.1 hypothetical protein AMYX_38370 [Anaeromyxobacter diazotrophicus]
MAIQRNGKGLVFPVEALFGGKIAPPALVKRGMADLEQRLNQRFRAGEAARREHLAALAKVHGPLRDLLGENEKVAAGVKQLRALQARYAKEQLAAPAAPEAKERIFTGSIGATVVPPFSYDWSWQASSNSPDEAASSADRGTGRMSFAAWANFDHGSSASVRAALGIYFRPQTENGILHLTSAPALNFGWGDWCVLDGAHTDGWLGLIVGRYNLSGGLDGWSVDQQLDLWSDDSWWSGTGWQTGSTSAHPLDAWFTVDSSHWYALWVWCGGDISAAGWGIFSGSGAGSTMSVAVPSITWELF